MTAEIMRVPHKFGVGIVSYNRPKCLERLLAVLYSSREVSHVVVVHTGSNPVISGPFESSATLDGFRVDHIRAPNYLPMARAVAENRLHKAGCDAFMLTDDDVVPSGDHLFRFRTRELERQVVGGASRTCWKSRSMIDDMDYEAYLRSDKPIPGGRVEPKTAIYGPLLLGHWKKIADMGADFSIEDQAWCYSVHKAGAVFNYQGFVGLHAPDDEPEAYPHFGGHWVNFKDTFDRLTQVPA